VLVTANELRLLDAGQVIFRAVRQWIGSVVGLDEQCGSTGPGPFHRSVRAQERLFTTKPIFLGLKNRCAILMCHAACG